MANIQTITHGEPNWDTKVNTNFQALADSAENVGGVVKGLQWTDFTDEGIVYQNGFENIGGAGAGRTGYRYIVIGNKKIVELQVALHLVSDPGSSVKNLTALSVPDAIAPDYVGTPHAQDDKYKLNFLDGRVDISKMKDSDGWWFGTGSFYQMHVMYISSK